MMVVLGNAHPTYISYTFKVCHAATVVSQAITHLNRIFRTQVVQSPKSKVQASL